MAEYKIEKKTGKITACKLNENEEILEIPSELFGKEVKKIGEYVFDSNEILRKVIIPDSVEEIGTYAFRECSSLEEIVIGQGVKRIDNHAFSMCTKLKSIVLPESLEAIWSYSFEKMEGFTVTIPRKIKHIDYYAFDQCKNWVINYKGKKEAWNAIETYGQSYSVGHRGLVEFNYRYNEEKIISNEQQKIESKIVDDALIDFLVSLEQEKVSLEEQRLYDLLLTKEEIQDTLEKALPIYKNRYPELEKKELKKKVYIDIYNYAIQSK